MGAKDDIKMKQMNTFLCWEERTNMKGQVEDVRELIELLNSSIIRWW